MPSPVGHSLLGLAMGVACYLPSGPWKTIWPRVRSAAPWLAGAVIVSNLPDLDYLPGLFRGNWNSLHHGFTHSVGWSVLVAVGLWLVGWAWRPEAGAREFLFLCALLLVHVLADYSCADALAPYGVMAFWPFSDRYIMDSTPIFWSLRKMTVTELFEFHNVQALGVELLWTLPVVALALAWKSRPLARPDNMDI